MQGVYSDLADEYDPKIALIGSKTFLDGTLGVSLSGQFEQRHIYSNNARTTGWLRRAQTPTGPNSIVGRYTDIDADGTAACTCPWWARYRGSRGKCKHVLAAELARADQPIDQDDPVAATAASGR